MKVFDLDRQVVENYSNFSRSFSTIRATDLRDEIKHQYDKGRFWPNALLSLNPHYETGQTVDELAREGELCPETAKVFRSGSAPVTFYRHQTQAIAKASGGNSFVVTTGTGSGKSLCFFVPIVDAVIRARETDPAPRTRAIIVYPMNALVNSQIEEIERFIKQSDLPSHLKPTVRRYTGQDKSESREEISRNPPDILLTNFMMAELLLTRQDSVNSKIIKNAEGIQFIVFDELHAYRGRQAADVAILIRRLIDRCSPDKAPVCIGTSATMVSEGEDERKDVAEVASLLFGVEIGPESVIDESLRRATDTHLNLKEVKPKLAEVIKNDLPEKLTDSDLKTHPLAVWVELKLGLDDRQSLKRRRPIPLNKAAEKLAKASGVDLRRCTTMLEDFLTRVSLPEKHRGGHGDQSFLAFKLHRFVSGAGEVFTTLCPQPRHVLLERQLEDPRDPGTRLYPIRFCRECGQEYYVVTKAKRESGTLFLPREIDDTPLEGDDDVEVAGYLTPVGDDDPEYRFDESLENFPESWTEESQGVLKLRANRKKRKPMRVAVARDGHQTEDKEPFWFIPGKFGFCARCLDEPQSRTREHNKLAGLTAEGRSSATTLFVSSALCWLNRPESEVPDDKRKLLGFSDNRQDAALQAGHFNDFLFVSLLRGAVLRAVLDAGDGGLCDDDMGLRVQEALGFTKDNEATRQYWMSNPNMSAVYRCDAQRAHAKVLAHRVWADLSRGWRFTNPNLLTLKLIKAKFLGLDEAVNDPERFSGGFSELASLDNSARRKVVQVLLEAMLEGLAVGTEALDPGVMDTVAKKSRSCLRAPWAIYDEEQLRKRATMFLDAPGKRSINLREERIILRAGPLSRMAREINCKKVLRTKLSGDDYKRFLKNLLDVLTSEGLLVRVPGDGGRQGWRISPPAVCLVPGEAVSESEARGNLYFHDLYMQVAGELVTKQSSLFGMEGREHTAQVDPKQREWREWRFRFEDADRKRLAEYKDKDGIKDDGESEQFLPALFCTPTMELGVDISALNTVYLRNVPPTPANYAQRAGRAGRSGQSAAIFSYCAALSPHDQYFFERRIDMVAGEVRPPALDITNENLVTSHLQAVWLAESELDLSPNITEILELKESGFPLKTDIRKVIQNRSLIDRARTPMRRVFGRIFPSADKYPPWMGDVGDYVDQVATQAPQEFDRAFDRWRELYRSARRQQEEAHKQLQVPGLSGAERYRLKTVASQATDQVGLLEIGGGGLLRVRTSIRTVI